MDGEREREGRRRRRRRRRSRKGGGQNIAYMQPYSTQRVDPF